MTARRRQIEPLGLAVDSVRVHERTLESGLKVLVIPSRQAPLVVCDLWYPAGSFDDPPGRSGLAHFVEHMLFKGTQQYPRGRIDELVVAAGGQANAECGEDSTRYWISLPSRSWELALAIEADRMQHARFRTAEVEAERRVIAEERARELDTPQGRLDQAVFANLYENHPYRNPIVGWPEDLARIRAFDLARFRLDYYRPQDAVFVIAGDVDVARAFERAESSVGQVRVGQSRVRHVVVDEPIAAGRREFVVPAVDGGPRGVLAWRTCRRGRPESYALEVAADILCGGRRSRLWSRLVEQDQVATWVEATNSVCWRDGHFLIHVEGRRAAGFPGLEGAIFEELDRLAEEGPSEAELLRAQRRLDAAERWERQDLASLAAAIGAAALWGDWRAWRRDYDLTARVGAEDVKRAVAGYLARDRVAVGWSRRPRPGSSSSGACAAVALPGASSAQPARKTAARGGLEPLPHFAGIARAGERSRASAGQVESWRRRLPMATRLANGLTLIHEPWAGAGVVAIELSIDAGQIRESTPGLACFTGRLLEEGTRRRSGSEFAALIEGVGGVIELGATGAQGRIRREDLPLALELVAEAVRFPAFPADSLRWVQAKIAADLRFDLEDPAFRADLLARRLIAGSHPLGRDPRWARNQGKALSRQDVIKHHARYFRPERSLLVVVGELDPRTLVRQVERAFGGWKSRTAGRISEPLEPPAPGRAKARTVRDETCQQAHLVLGHLCVPRRHPDFDALLILDHILGSGPGVCDRLSRVVRDELGLAYAVWGGMTDTADILPGFLRIYAGVAPGMIAQAEAAIRHQVAELHAGRFLDSEVEQARRYLAASWLYDLQGVEPRAERLLELARHELPLCDPHPEARFERITPAVVREAAKKHLHPDRLVRVEIGPEPQRRKRP